ncbi:MAG: DEAD/DEAH box helicase family protein [Candidatus Riflebacteria bacterium]|nr:DEAD/DEAH box helicase family protein [Candidatus Riflebacteria bacterium]
MSIQHVNTISNRLSLRKPQRESLEILQRLCEIIPLEKDADTTNLLAVVQSEFAHVKAFDRDFASLCFAIATGVGKTRLMGAFISYLYLSEGIRHFFVIAPNLTIYNKLIADFTPNTPKYVFKGIGEFAQNPPLIITGDNYESGQAIRRSKLLDEDVHINIFNISKITAKDKGKFAADDEKKNIPRFRRLREEIGESYFDYLAGLDDLVVIMDESHRYRADAGLSAINELKPVLGLELTATPQIERGNSKTEAFNNVIFSYPLSCAMDDGFVKEPAVATRENFDPANYSESALEKLKLEDAVCIHEVTKVELEIYARNNNQKIIKPFMLIVAQDTGHANALQKLVESAEFFASRYKGKVITIHSKSTKGNEGDEIVQQLLTVEDAYNPIEIVIHVNMLKEGWDVTNLYTIVPLRAANSKTLVEQSIGRGLRLPYGKRVGIPAVDRLTIVSHDRFQEIIDHANDPDSIIRSGIVIGRDIPENGKKAVIVKTTFENLINKAGEDETPILEHREGPVFTTGEEREIASVTIDIIAQYEGLKSSQDLQNPDIQKEISEKVKERIRPRQDTLDYGNKIDVAMVVTRATRLYTEFTIDIPKIVVLPKGKPICGYRDFDLDLSGINLQPVSQDILVQHLHDRQRFTMQSGSALVEEKRHEDYIVRSLSAHDDICYEEHAKILYKLASQMIKHIRSYLKTDAELLNVLQYHQQRLADIVYLQMQEHYFETAAEYEAHVTKGFHTLRSSNFSSSADENVRGFRVAVPEGQRNQIKNMIFGGFAKCLYPIQKFDSDSERRFAVILENDPSVKKWFKPAKGDFQIKFSANASYEPDFVVETESGKYLCEPKRASEMNDETVLAKAKAANTWCKHATAHAQATDKKSWAYLLIPHDQISEQMTLAGFAAAYTL